LYTIYTSKTDVYTIIFLIMKIFFKILVVQVYFFQMMKDGGLHKRQI